MNPDLLAVIVGSLIGLTLLCACLTMYYSYRLFLAIHHRLDHLQSLTQATPTFLRGSRVVVPRRASRLSDTWHDAETDADADAI